MGSRCPRVWGRLERQVSVIVPHEAGSEPRIVTLLVIIEATAAHVVDAGG